jgi:hypothetical protein
MSNNTQKNLFHRSLSVTICILFLSACSSSFAQTDTTFKKQNTTRRIPKDSGIVKKLTVMPYATISYNLQSGQAFPRNASGIGYGFGLAFDLTEDKQPLGAYFDFAYQDMRASANDGAAKLVNPADTVTTTVPVTHYFSYFLLEGFLKFQTLKNNGYFLLGVSTGISTTSLSVKTGPPPDQYADWSGTPFYNKLRLDIRAGIGIKLGYISGHQVVFEARFGYPVTTAISDYSDFANSNGAHGSWRIVSLQGNIGLRL